MLTIDSLREVPLLQDLPDDQLKWLLSQGTEVWLTPGQVHWQDGDPAEQVFVLLDGQVHVTQDVDHQEVLLSTYTEKTLYGELPVLMGMTHFWASARAVTHCHIFELPNDAFWQLLSSCTCVMTKILRTMALRIQGVQMLSQHREKMVALGTLAAGMAHELNNPAAAAQRAVGQLRDTLRVLQPATLQLCQPPIEDQYSFLNALQQQVLAYAKQAPVLDPLLQSDREDEITQWLDQRGVQEGWKLASNFVSAGLDIGWLETIASQITPSFLGHVLCWLDATLTSAKLLDDLEHSTERISKLVQAVKDYSYMDQAPVQEVDIHAGLEGTLRLLNHKLKRGITVIRDYHDQVPCITAYGSELNQVWTNLIDNAIDALEQYVENYKAAHPDEQNGHAQRCQLTKRAVFQPTIWLRTWPENNHVIVEIADNGPGIPPELQSHIFEPFFTTKAIGKGTGLGLHIVYRVIVRQHKGDCHLFSQPGNTRFQIRLPINL